MTNEMLLKRAYEVVHHDHDCPAIGGNGDIDCKCDAVPFLKDLKSALGIVDKPTPLTDLYIPPALLELLDEKFQWFARDENGRVYAYTSKPNIHDYVGWSNGDIVAGISAFPSVRPGTKPWDQSLISRADLMKGVKR